MNYLLLFFTFWSVQHHCVETLQDKKDSSNVAKIDESVKRIARCETKLPFRRHSRHRVLEFVTRNGNWRQSHLFVEQHEKNELPLRVFSKLKILPQQTLTHFFGWFTFRKDLEIFIQFWNQFWIQKNKIVKRGSDGPKRHPKWHPEWVQVPI